MSADSIDCEVRAARDPETGEVHELLSIPDGYVACLIPREVADAHADWRECCAVRITVGEDGTVGEFAVTNDVHDNCDRCFPLADEDDRSITCQYHREEMRDAA